MQRIKFQRNNVKPDFMKEDLDIYGENPVVLKNLGNPDKNSARIDQCSILYKFHNSP